MKQQAQMVESGTNKASTNFYVYDIETIVMAAADAGQPAIPEDSRDTIATAAAMLYWQDQGVAFQDQARTWERNFEKELAESKKTHKKRSRDPRIAESHSPDAGMDGNYEVHSVT